MISYVGSTHVLFWILELIFCFFKWDVFSMAEQNIRMLMPMTGSKSVLKYQVKVIWYVSNLVE